MSIKMMIGRIVAGGAIAGMVTITGQLGLGWLVAPNQEAYAKVVACFVEEVVLHSENPDCGFKVKLDNPE